MRTTKLDAVNEILTSIGEQPVNALGSSHPDAAIAEFKLNQVSRQVQSQGWQFNTELTYKILPDVNGEILIPDNALEVTESSHCPWDTLVIRGDKFYDVEKQTFTINEPVEVRIVFELDFEELPETARTFIAMRAARRFQASVVGSQELAGYTGQDERLAWRDLLQADADAATPTLLDQPGATAGLTRQVRGAQIFRAFGV